MTHLSQFAAPDVVASSLLRWPESHGTRTLASVTSSGFSCSDWRDSKDSVGFNGTTQDSAPIPRIPRCNCPPVGRFRHRRRVVAVRDRQPGPGACGNSGLAGLASCKLPYLKRVEVLKSPKQGEAAQFRLVLCFFFFFYWGGGGGGAGVTFSRSLRDPFNNGVILQISGGFDPLVLFFYLLKHILFFFPVSFKGNL